uniref:Uncharacterized protein n=1 Tax=Rhizophora mucronata TaxID=61149 RepID=A0A2P2QXH0_RHIMU
MWLWQPRGGTFTSGISCVPLLRASGTWLTFEQSGAHILK